MGRPQPMPPSDSRPFFYGTRKSTPEPKYDYRNAPEMSADPDIIRPYGPGKFSHIIDSYVYEESLEGGETIGDVSEMGEAATPVEIDAEGIAGRGLRGELPDRKPLTKAEYFYLRQHPYAIVYEDNEGFVSVSYFTSKSEYDAAIRHAEKAQSDFYQEQGGEN